MLWWSIMTKQHMAAPILSANGVKHGVKVHLKTNLALMRPNPEWWDWNAGSNNSYLQRSAVMLLCTDTLCCSFTPNSSGSESTFWIPKQCCGQLRKLFFNFDLPGRQRLTSLNEKTERNLPCMPLCATLDWIAHLLKTSFPLTHGFFVCGPSWFLN